MQGGIPGIVVYIQFCGFTLLAFVLPESAAQAEDESDCPEAPPESDEASMFVVRREWR